jgi:CHU_C Type IX secretion signal domain
MRKLATLVLLLLALPLSASHIVGGEIELLHISGSSYRINLIYYFDVARNPNRNPQAEEPNIEVYIYRKSDNHQMRSVQLSWVKKTRVPYTQPSCSSGEIISDKILYTAIVELTPAEYSDPLGYYVTWVRCCRNYSILNVFSQDPAKGGIGAGQTFFLEFPPVTVNGQPFKNSSPRDFPALNDYACPTKPYYVDFAGIDDDGDSLAYTLVTPLSTVTVTPTPPPTPLPYPLVQWLPGFGLDKIVNGSPKSTTFPDLTISTEGFLRVTPRSQGLYVFAVKVEEFRNKVKIGETRRDFQMLVTDCRISAPPEIKGKPLNGTNLVSDNLSVKFNNTVADQDRCITVSVTDPDANRAADNFQEFIRLKVVPLNFKNKDLASLLPAESTGFINGNGTIEFNICFPVCPFFTGGAYQIGVIAFDDACALPLSDTLKVEVEVQEPHNERAKFVPPDVVTATLNEGDQMTWQFEARDAEKDELLFFVLTDGFAMDKSGMKTEITSNEDGVMKGNVKWNAFCDIYDFTKRTNFTLTLMVDDVDQCDLNDPDTATYHLRVELPKNADPIIDTDLTINPAEVEVNSEKRIYDRLSFNVTGKDIIDNDLITLNFSGDGFKSSDYGMSFAKASATGTVSSAFTWDLACDKLDLTKRDEFNIGFVAIDSIHKCRVRQIDSLVVKVKVLKPLNSAPKLSIVNVSNATYFDGEALVSPGQELALELNVVDTDISPKDKLTIDLIDIGGDQVPEGWAFQGVEGPSVLTSLFRWSPQCSIFSGDVFEHDFYFDFRYSDDRCLTAVVDTVRVNVKVKDVESGNFLADPANVFTPNDDGFNDYYSMERRDATGTLTNILPPDNCRGVFENIRIYNRWGKTVFISSDRNFRWLGLDEAAGVYFYHVKFTNREFKGTVSLRN